MSSRVSPATRKIVVERAGRRCEYCRSPMRFSPAPFSVDHIAPRAQGGGDDFENLALACQGCNGPKFTCIDAHDPVSGVMTPLFHPRRHSWDEHFGWSEDYTNVMAKTAVGRVTISRLKLNREEIVELRALLRLIGAHPPPVTNQ